MLPCLCCFSSCYKKKHPNIYWEMIIFQTLMLNTLNKKRGNKRRPKSNFIGPHLVTLFSTEVSCFRAKQTGAFFQLLNSCIFCSCLFPRYDWKWNTKLIRLIIPTIVLNNMCPAFELWCENNLSKMSSHRKTRAASTFLIFRPCFFRAVLFFPPFYGVALHSLPSVGWSYRSFFFEKKSKMYSTVR